MVQSIMRRIKNGHDTVTYREDTSGYLVLVSPYHTVAFSALNNLWRLLCCLKKGVDTEN